MKVFSSGGEILCDLNGKVLEVILSSDYEKEYDLLREIERFNMSEWDNYWKQERQKTYDILDLGYWLKDGKYEPPSLEWRTGNLSGFKKPMH